jgi:NAD(P)-dependent dehydrogenase (short-subunit alcohol dehydrogenase family)
MELDLTSLKSVKKFAGEFKAKYKQLDVLLNNAGIMMVPFGKTEDGFERQFGTNHLGHFALTGLLIDLILKTPSARIVNVSSNGHRHGEMDFGNLMFEDGNDYSPMKAYGRSKLANLLFTYELQRRFDTMGADVIAAAAHPGMANTHLADHIFNKFPFVLMRPFNGLVVQSAAMGALPSIRAAVDVDVIGGQYFGPEGRREAKGYPILVESNEASHNEDDAKKLWEASEELTGINFLNS